MRYHIQYRPSRQRFRDTHNLVATQAIAGDTDADTVLCPGKRGCAIGSRKHSGGAAQADRLTAVGGQIRQRFALGNRKSRTTCRVAERENLASRCAQRVDTA